MEIKINREIRGYFESVLFGLSMRQTVYSCLAVVFAVAVYFLLKPILPLSVLSWLCIVASSPFAALGFFTYNGMDAAEFLKVIFRFAFLEPRVYSGVSMCIYTYLFT